ncbi:single-stranded-DNA-specific exonuclease RecJ [Methylocystis sp. L43]|uniref:single-stranded-DNA-specific exonuclease RecJ n=1 Tax=unclassified Methylocystis TaxID=2625913 RepID=UPI0018C34C87|nr:MULTISPECIES: single-stranded-DNA-specific exonuclease RecJ [unclassified Methylocystis]MBG0798243.1 single-stranded-DNA-specific exonuclease RecJ [Methylocystis sp. L43]MBG0805672.1 single-stranded-DNA-specific exonuclease RecJ [Methylocystis sp. H15]
MSDSMVPAFLGVERSVLGRRWRGRLDARGEAQALALTQAHGIDDFLARVIAGRGVTVADAAGYLDPKLRDLLPDPSSLRDMDAATHRLAEAIEKSEQIAVFGDYDVDGACSSALLIDFWRAAGAPEPLLHIPDRIIEGYGPNVEAIRDLAARGATLLITVDCGTSSHEAFAVGRALGLDVIVLDHHQAPEVLPDALVVNPNRLDDLSGQGALCAAGVVFLVLIGLSRTLRARGWWSDDRPEPDLLAALDLVALATVADVSPLARLNRALVAKGLMVMGARSRPGLAALMDAARLDGPPRANHLGFALGPRINAGGRIGDAGLGARLLTLADGAEARRIALELDRLNDERQVVERMILEQAVAEAEAQIAGSNRLSCLVVHGQEWHPGVVGLIASRLKERFNLPAFVIAFNGQYGTGSGRSLSGVDLGAAVRRAVEMGLAVKGGGHAMAAGVTLAKGKIDDFRAFLDEALEASVEAARLDDALVVDAAVAGRGVCLELLRRVERAGPFGQGNPEPLFALPEQQVTFAQTVGADHVRARLRSRDGATVDAIAFRAVQSPLGEALLRGDGAQLHVAAKLSRNVFRGIERVETRIVDLARVQ